VTVFHDELTQQQAAQLAAEIDRRLRSCRFRDPTRSDRVFVFRGRENYETYLKLAFLDSVPQGFNLSRLGNSYVCEAVVSELGLDADDRPRFSLWEGSVAHIAAHELGHQYISDLIGPGRWRALPHWKREGLPEYIANIGDIQADPSQSLFHRVGVLLDDASWTAIPPGRRPGWDRLHYEAGLMVEFQFEVRGLSLEQVVSDGVTKEETRAAMLLWAEKVSGTFSLRKGS